MDGLNNIDNLFKQYGEKQYLAVRECGYQKRLNNKEIKKIAMQYKELTIGGVQRVISLLTPMYLEMGYEVIVIVEKLDNNLDYTLPNDVEVFVIPQIQVCFQRNCFLERAEAIQDIIEKEQVDVVCYHDATASVLLYDFMIYNQKGVNFITVKHEYISQYMVNMGDQLYNQKSVLPLLDKVIVLSQAEKKFWEQLGVDTEYIYNPIGDYAIARHSEKNRNIGWIGRLDSNQKQYLDVIPIMREVVKSVPDACLKIYGREYEEGAVKKLQDAIKHNGLEQNVIYCGYTTDNVGDIYSDMTIHLVTSAYESFPMGIYESRLNGLPLVLYQMPYLELLKNGKGYIEVANDDTKGAATAIVKLLRDDALWNKLSIEASESVKEFSNEEVKQGWKRIFEDIRYKNTSVALREDPVIKNVLDAMLYHYHKGCLNHQKNLQINADKVLTEKIAIALQTNKLPIVIYPYGTIGKKVQKILNERFHVRETFVVDNALVQEGMDIRKIEELESIDCSKYCFLVCSNSKMLHEKIRGNLRQYVSEQNIIDLFPMI
uniref:glycosyltransferase family 4 protein n=1 Tax=Acetatifactor sp. TaxID=1872090 RepID=UPI004055F5C3